MERHLLHRMRKERLPRTEDVIMARVKSYTDIACIVELLQYGNIEAYVLQSEMSSRAFRSNRAISRIGTVRPVYILNVDATRGYVDASFLRVKPSYIKECEETYSEEKQVHTILAETAMKSECDMSHLYESIWGVTENPRNFLKRYIEDAESIDIPESVVLYEISKKHLRPKTKTVTVAFDVIYYGPEGVEMIKNILSVSDIPVRYQSNPKFTMSMETLDVRSGLISMSKSLGKIKKECERVNAVYSCTTDMEYI